LGERLYHSTPLYTHTHTHTHAHTHARAHRHAHTHTIVAHSYTVQCTWLDYPFLLFQHRKGIAIDVYGQTFALACHFFLCVFLVPLCCDCEALHSIILSLGFKFCAHAHSLPRHAHHCAISQWPCDEHDAGTGNSMHHQDRSTWDGTAHQAAIDTQGQRGVSAVEHHVVSSRGATQRVSHRAAHRPLPLWSLRGVHGHGSLRRDIKHLALAQAS
jgi:hypothetical protein